MQISMPKWRKNYIWDFWFMKLFPRDFYNTYWEIFKNHGSIKIPIFSFIQSDLVNKNKSWNEIAKGCPMSKKMKMAWSWSTLTAVGDSVMQLLCDKICFEKLRNVIQGPHHWRTFTNSVNIINSMTRQKKYHTECRLTAKSKVVQRSW